MPARHSPDGRPSATAIVGIDENGLGPLLGPLVVTAAFARASSKGLKFATKKASGSLEDRIGDSKRLVRFGDTALGEAWARAIVERACHPGGELPATPAEVLARITTEGLDSLQADCPSQHVGMCWGTTNEEFCAPKELVDECARDLDMLRDRHEVSVERVRSTIVCARRLNQASSANLSRFEVDLHAMEELILDAQRHAGVEVEATCGKVGGYGAYLPKFRHLGAMPITVVTEGRARSEYCVDTIGRVSFVRDADDDHLLVSLASLVGKWVRDLLMRRIVRFHQGFAPDAPDASGYHDPTTKRFVERTEATRRTLPIESACFERTSRNVQPTQLPLMGDRRP